MLDVERQFYDENLSAWLSQHAGRFVLVKERELLGVFDTIEAALAEGARLVGLQPFLVRRVEQSRPEVRIPALSLGILHADLAHPADRTGTSS